MLTLHLSSFLKFNHFAARFTKLLNSDEHTAFCEANGSLNNSYGIKKTFKNERTYSNLRKFMDN